MFNLEEANKKCRELSDSIFESWDDGRIDEAIQKGVEDGLKNSKPFEGQWIGQDGHPVDTPNWIV